MGTDGELLRPVGIGSGLCGVGTSGIMGNQWDYGDGGKKQKGCSQLRTSVYILYALFRFIYHLLLHSI